MPPVTVKREVGVGDLLTAATIAISLISVLISWNVDRQLRRTTEANDIREAAAAVLADLERTRELAFSVFPQMQSAIVEASEIATEADAGGRRRSVERARDFLWKQINGIHNGIVLKLIDERVDTGYIRLFSYYPGVRPLYQDAIARVRARQADMIQNVLAELEPRILGFGDATGDVFTAMVGNSLRVGAARVEALYRDRFAGDLRRAERYLVEKIEADDDAVLDGEEPRPPDDAGA